ncbi:beta family protein [Candidatus Sumerlaeota bacterium]|nr:beta family protein [Candidatus Sumerlaeota bacterium]
MIAVTFNHRHYVPCLRWKQGEYQAILRLSDAAKDFITPLIEVPGIGFDFDSRKQNKVIDDHLAPFAQRVKTKWQRRPLFVDMKLIGLSEQMAGGQHPVRFVFDELRAQKCIAAPVTGIDRDTRYQQAVKQAVSADQRGVCLRVSLVEAEKPALKNSIDTLLGQIRLQADGCDFVLDLGAPNFEPVEGFAGLVTATIRKLPYLSQWRTFALIGTSFPSSMGEIKESPAIVPRSEWLLYKRVFAGLLKAGIRVPTFGDYGINHPADVPELDWRLVKPYATIRYTINDNWLIVRGRNVRDHGFEQYRDHCRTVKESPHFSPRGLSYGDNYIANCATGSASTGNLSTWRMVGTNHHIEKVAFDISNFFGPLGID